MEFIITYETLFDTLRREKSRDDLQKLPENFYQLVAEFLQKKPADNELAEIEYRNTKKIIKELYERRERKIILMALNKSRVETAMIDLSVLLPEERRLFDQLLETLKRNKEETINELMAMKPSKSVQGLVAVRFLSDVPKLIAPDMRTFGPFRKGDEAELPEKIVEILVRKQKAEIISNKAS